jgi:hypothetical protein
MLPDNIAPGALKAAVEEIIALSGGFGDLLSSIGHDVLAEEPNIAAVARIERDKGLLRRSGPGA